MEITNEKTWEKHRKFLSTITHCQETFKTKTPSQNDIYVFNRRSEIIIVYQCICEKYIYIEFQK